MVQPTNPISKSAKWLSRPTATNDVLLSEARREYTQHHQSYHENGQAN